MCPLGRRQLLDGDTGARDGDEGLFGAHGAENEERVGEDGVGEEGLKGIGGVV